MCNNSMTITYEDVVKAQQTQNKIIRKTNLEFSETFSKICGANVYLKKEYEHGILKGILERNLKRNFERNLKF